MSKILMKALLGLILALTLATAAGLCRAQPTRADPFTQRFAALVSQRLAISTEVAWTKFNSGTPVYDPARESAMLENVVTTGTAKGISEPVVRTFFQAQVVASREVQIELIAAWRASGRRPETKPLDLKTELRPKLDAVNADLVSLLSIAPGLFTDPDALKWIRTDLAKGGYSDKVIALATASKD